MSPKISPSEWEVMNVLWSRSKATASEVFESLPPGHGWKQKTVNTFLTRLVDKGVLEAIRDGRAFSYAPRLKRSQCVAQEGAHFLQRVFQGETGALLLHFGERADLSDEEIRELEKLLKAQKGRK